MPAFKDGQHPVAARLSGSKLGNCSIAETGQSGARRLYLTRLGQLRYLEFSFPRAEKVISHPRLFEEGSARGELMAIRPLSMSDSEGPTTCNHRFIRVEVLQGNAARPRNPLPFGFLLASLISHCFSISYDLAIFFQELILFLAARTRHFPRCPHELWLLR